MKTWLSSALAGFLFGVGLAIAGMTQPAKVIGFLDVFGSWDPSLAFVMGGAILVYAPLHRLVLRRTQPLFVLRFVLPKREDVDLRLIAGAGIFGIGWGLGGFCPGPGLTSLGARVPEAFVFSGSMVAGFLLHRLWDRAKQPTPAPPIGAPRT